MSDTPILPASDREKYRALYERREAYLKASSASPGIRSVSLSTAGSSQSVTALTEEEWAKGLASIEAQLAELLGRGNTPPRFSNVVQDTSRF